MALGPSSKGTAAAGGFMQGILDVLMMNKQMKAGKAESQAKSMGMDSKYFSSLVDLQKDASARAGEGQKGAKEEVDLYGTLIRKQLMDMSGISPEGSKAFGGVRQPGLGAIPKALGGEQRLVTPGVGAGARANVQLPTQEKAESSIDTGGGIIPRVRKEGVVVSGDEIQKTASPGDKSARSGAGAEITTKLRKEFVENSQPFVKSRDAYSRLVASGKNPSAAGDLSLIFNYMKILDPGSVVRESEFATAAATGAWGDRIKGAAEKILSGERFDDHIRNDFLDRGEKLYEKQQQHHKKRESEYSRIATNLGVDKRNVIVDMTAEEEPATEIPLGATLVPKKTTKDGAPVYKHPNGKYWTP